jgi:predicted dehydrogenase/nucleoside-diphosphate-sugar epimerase
MSATKPNPQAEAAGSMKRTASDKGGIRMINSTVQANRIFKVGLVGAGYISPFHIRALQALPNVKIIGITDRVEARAQQIVQQFHLPAAFSSLQAMAAERPDVIHVMTPPSTHTEVTLEAISMGCHVLVEKPLATDPRDCDKIADAAREKGVIVCVNHSLLCDPFISQALHIVRGGGIGEVVTVHYLRSSDYPPYPGGPLPVHYREGGYPFRDIGVHALYLVDLFLGKIEDVSGTFVTQGKGDPNMLYDEWQALVRCERGIGHIQLSWNVRPLQNLLIIQGTKGIIRADLFSMAVTCRKNTPLPKSIERVINAMGEAKQTLIQVPKNVLGFLRGRIKPYHGLQTLVAGFYQGLATGMPPIVTPEQAKPIIAWTERFASVADSAKIEFQERFSRPLKARVLVTGATGFIGRYLVRRLLAKQPGDGGPLIRLFVRRPPKEWMNDSRVEVVLGDLGDPEAVARAVFGVETIYHVGAAMSGGQADFERGTIVGTQNIIEASLSSGVKEMIYISSLSVLHASLSQPGKKIKEDWPLEPHPERRGHYTYAKLAAERMIVRAVKEKGLRAVILRPGQVFGPGAPVLTPAVARRAKDRFIVLGNGQFVLPLVYVEDVIDAILQAAALPKKEGSIFQLVDSAQITQNQFLDLYMTRCGISGKVVHVPLLFVYGMAFGVQILCKLLRRPPPLSIYRVASALAPMTFDCGAAREGLSWQPRVGVAAGLEETFQSEKK